MIESPRAVIVTGSGGSGCGRAIAARFARDGNAVVVSDIDEAGGHETVRAIEEASGRAAFLRADMREKQQVRDLIAFCQSTFGIVSVLVNNASAAHAPVDGLAGWMDTIQTDLLGSIHATRWAIEAMRHTGGGSIVNIAFSSALWHGRATPGGFPGYDIAKAGLIRMTTGLASLAETDGIRVNCLAPGWIATDGPLQYWESLTPAERAARGVPSRLLMPAQVADLVVQLAGDESLNGRVLVWWSEDALRLIRWGDRGLLRCHRISALWKVNGRMEAARGA
jgi:NAD(P)-dependent dehydrogenase (short-subunit alcohol dehydrogenase family)